MKLCVFCYSVFICEKKYVILYLSLCHSVSKSTSVSLPVTLLFCLKNRLLCYSCLTLLPCLPYPVSLPVPLLFCLKKPQLGTEAGPAVVVIVTFLSVLYQYFISCATSSPTTFLQYILFYKVVEVTCCGIL